MAGIVIRPRARIFHGHDWVYASEVLKTFGQPEDGDVVSLKDGRDRMLGSAIYNSRSQIIARRFSRRRQELDRDFFDRRIAQAIEYRERRGVPVDRCRLVWSESDGLPGLIVDRYGTALVVQALTTAMDRRLPLIAEVLRERVQPEVIVERDDAPIRRAEGLDLRTGLLHGALDGSGTVERVIVLDGIEFRVDLLHGQKTGFYLDQVENYETVARFAAGRRVLDCFANQGAFALVCAKRGAAEVTAVEVSPEAVDAIGKNAAANNLSVDAVEANVFDFLKQAEQKGSTYDLIVLDPPSFTKSRGKVQDAMRGYKEIHLRALKLLAPNGLLATFSCSHHVGAEVFLDTIVEAMTDAKRTVRQLARLTQAPDHPIIPGIPETEYLKGFLFELAPGR